MKFRTAEYDRGGDGTFYLWIGNPFMGTGQKQARVQFSFYSEGVRFTAKAQEINERTGEKMNRQVLESEKQGMQDVIKYKRETRWGFVRFNITFK